jgi:hypothetical protein
MAYKFTNASMSINGKTPKEDYIGLFQETLNQQFYNSSDWWTIQEEIPYASDSFVNTDVRITHVINAETGVKLGDDWKTILFKEVDHEIYVGRLYMFDDNTWLVVNTEVIKNLTATATVKRCNNMLRWVDVDTGALYTEPCTIDYLIKEPRDYATAGSALVTPSGYVQIKAQFNSRTNTIRPNQRFLFGNPTNWTAYKVVGTGMNNYNNLQTTDNMSAGILLLEMVANYVNYETDDITLGIADVNQNIYTVSINETGINGVVGTNVSLTTTVTYNGNTVTRPITWSSSNTSIATVSSSGVVSMVAAGSAVITANITNNSASATRTVTVNPSGSANNRSVVISPNTNYIFEGETSVYSVFLYVNGAVQGSTFTITCAQNSVPLVNYSFTQTDGNHFSIKNIERCLISNLTVTCTSGTDIGTMNIFLKGAW